MILAAGAGSRLRPLTETTPKALIEVGGVTMLERIARRLIAAGADRLIVNVHHHSGQIARFAARLASSLGIEIAISHEEERPLDTGGALMHAAPLFRRDRQFFLHNVDIITDLDLRALAETHRGTGALATLAVNHRETSRTLLFDERGLYGRTDERKGATETVRHPVGRNERIAFAGVHAVSPGILAAITERGAFSILDAYLRLAAAGHSILPYDVSDASWLEIGTPERLAKARLEIAGSAPISQPPMPQLPGSPESTRA